MRDTALDFSAELDEGGAGLSVMDLYRRMLERRRYIADPAQLRAVERLQTLFEEWTSYKERRRNALLRMLVKPPLPRGVYLWGGVGRGKSFLMDAFYVTLPVVRKRRVHFHHFMREVHREMRDLKGKEDPLTEVAFRIAKRHRLICFDEFHVNDIADAMILGRLLERTIRFGVVYCMTSNYAPDQLYRDGLKRDDFLPAIALIKRHLDVLNVDNGVDYRRRAMERIKAYHTPLGAATDASLGATFAEIADIEEERHELDIDGRVIPYVKRAGGVVWFDFAVICGWGRSQNDYIDLATRFHTVIVSGVPRMDLSMADEARRFTLLVDVFYDRRVNLILGADAPPEGLLEAEPNAGDARLRAMQFEFERTASRLLDMQTIEYLAEARRAGEQRNGDEIEPDAGERPVSAA